MAITWRVLSINAGNSHIDLCAFDYQHPLFYCSTYASLTIVSQSLLVWRLSLNLLWLANCRNNLVTFFSDFSVSSVNFFGGYFRFEFSHLKSIWWYFPFKMMQVMMYSCLCCFALKFDASSCIVSEAWRNNTCVHTVQNGNSKLKPLF